MTTTPETVLAFCLSLPGAGISAETGGGQALVVQGERFAILTPGPGLSFRCTRAAFRTLVERPGVTPCLAREGWVSLAGPEALPGEELLDLLRLAYGLVVTGLPEKERRALLQALRVPPVRH